MLTTFSTDNFKMRSKSNSGNFGPLFTEVVSLDKNSEGSIILPDLHTSDLTTQHCYEGELSEELFNVVR